MTDRLFTTLALAAVLLATSAQASQPSAYAMATHPSLRGWLVSDPEHPVVTASVYFSEDESGFPSIDAMTREGLRAEARRLGEESPSIAFGLTLTILGGCGIFTGVVLLYIGLVDSLLSFGSSASAATAYILLGLGAALTVGAGIMLAIGIVRLVGSIRERRAYGTRIDEINRRLEGTDLAPPAFPGGDAPPPPPAALGNVPDATMVVATF